MTTFTQPFVLTSSASTGAPAQAAAAGFTNAVVNENWTRQSIAPSTASGVDGTGTAWTWWPAPGQRVGTFNVDSSADSAVDMYIYNGLLYIKIDNGSGDATAVRSQPPDQANGGEQSWGNTPTSRPGATLLPNQYGRLWTYGYYEISMKFDVLKFPGAFPYPGVWMGQCYNGGLSASSPGGQQPVHCEIDIMEINGSNTDTNNATSSSLWQWGLAGNAGNNSGSPGDAHVTANLDYSQFNTYGCLWTPSQITFYRNDTAVSEPNAGHPSPITLDPNFSGSIDNYAGHTARPTMVYQFGTGRGSPWLNVVQWVRIWQ